MRTGSPSYDLPAALGYVRFTRWRDMGVWAHMAQTMGSDTDRKPLFLDSTFVRTHQYSVGAQKKRARKRSFVRGVG